ncbi:MAG TPA: hypothetical protein VJN62_08505 [Gemmatimonadales bacterium]|nr:hypothetical protein [Gemmatimonadales bacterium]
MGRSAVVLLATSVLCAGAVHAQLASRTAFNPDVVCTRLTPGQLTRVEYDVPLSGGTLGPDVSCDRTGVTLDAYAGQPGPQTIDAGAIRQLWVRRGSGLAGAIWGGIAGGLAGYALASARTHLCSAPPGSPIDATRCHGSIPVGITLGLATGVGIGWFFGRGIPRWSLVYRAHP